MPGSRCEGKVQSKQDELWTAVCKCCAWRQFAERNVGLELNFAFCITMNIVLRPCRPDDAADLADIVMTACTHNSVQTNHTFMTF